MMDAAADRRYMAAAIAISMRGRGLSTPNPNVGCLIVRHSHVVGRGWTQAGGRPHAEAQALAQAADLARGATAYVSLEPCFHLSPRGPRCSDLLLRAGVARVVIAARDPDPRTDGQGAQYLRDNGVDVTIGLMADEARRAMAGFFARDILGRPAITLKLATSLDGQIAAANGASRWITGPAARRHGHLERAQHNAILVGRGTVEADRPSLDVRIDGLARRSPRRYMLGSGDAPAGWTALRDPQEVRDLPNTEYLMVEGGAEAAAAFLRADLVDRLLLYRAPIIMGRGKAALGDIGLESPAQAHDRWRPIAARMLGPDRMEVYERVRGG